MTKRETVKIGEDYHSSEVSIERTRPSGTPIHDAIVDIETEIDNALDRFRRDTVKPTPTAPASAPPVAVSLTSASSPRIPETGWTTFKSGKGSWIRSEEAAELVAFLAKSDKKSAVISGYLYKLSGESDQFINRFTHKGGSLK